LKPSNKFNQAATGRFGSGWAWLILNDAGQLRLFQRQIKIILMDIVEEGQPLLGLDVWEHAYYLKYQNRRADYTKAFWSVVNWNTVNQRYDAAIK
jgi:Fe-Mn family superoxide dismutase